MFLHLSSFYKELRLTLLKNKLQQRTFHENINQYVAFQVNKYINCLHFAQVLWLRGFNMYAIYTTVSIDCQNMHPQRSNMTRLEEMYIL